MQENVPKKKIILTGATGVIGAGIVRVCEGSDWDICAVVRPGSKKNKYIEGYGAKIIPCDLQDIESLARNSDCMNADYFIHLGWSGTKKADRENRDIQQKNIECAVAACKTAHELGCSTFLFAGSQAEYGRTEGGVTPELSTEPISEYGKAKLRAGQQTAELCKQYGMKHIYTRILSVYGPCNELDTMVMLTIIKLLQGKKPSFTPGEQLWDYMYSDDAANALLLLAEKGRNGQVYCLGSGNVQPLKDYIQIIGKVVDDKIPLGIGEIPYASNHIMAMYADISALQQDTGFVPCISFEEGIRRTRDWIVKHELDKE